MGTGIASRFSLALSRVIESPTPNVDLQSDDDIVEILQLVQELNQHQDLTVKLNNQSKICNIFKKGGKSTAKKIDQKFLDPQIQQVLDKCRIELEKLQEQKEQAVEEFLEEHTESRIMGIKKLQKELKLQLDQIADPVKKAAQEEENNNKVEELKQDFNN